MRTYFSYLFRTLVKRSSIWIVFAIYWIYALVILIIVPAVTHISPLTLWSTDLISLQGMFVVIISVVLGVVVVFTFRASIEDETELVIVSKPIKRWKLNIVKFSWVLICSLFLALVTSIISLFTMCFGNYDAVNNPAGMNFDKIPALIGSIWLGTVITSLIYGAFGILVSMIGNRIQILVTLIATSIVFSVYATIASFVLTPLNKQMQGKIGNKLASFKTINQTGDNESYAYTFNEPNNDLYDLYKEYPQTGNQVYQYFNFQAQQSGLYNAFNVNDLDSTLESTPFGASAAYKTTIKNREDNLLNYFIKMYDEREKNKDNTLLFMPFTDAVLKDDNYKQQGTENLNLILVGPKTDALFAMKYAGAKSDSIYVSNSTKLLGFFPARWLSMKDLYVSKDFEKDVFDNITKELFAGGCNFKMEGGEMEVLKYREILGDWGIISSPTDGQKWNEQQQRFQDYFGLCYKFIKANGDKYGLKYDKEIHINDSMAKIWTALVKQFSWIYWNQAIPQIIQHFKNAGVKDPNTGEDYSFKQYINCNDVGAVSGEETKDFTTFQLAFKQPKLTIQNPYTEETILDESKEFTLLQLVRMCMGYASTCTFTQDSLTSAIANALSTYNNIGNDTLPGAYGHIKQVQPKIKPEEDTGGWAFDFSDSSYGRGQTVIFNAIDATKIDIKECDNQFGLANMYRYKTTPYIDNNTAIIVWTIVSLIMIGVSGIVYQRSDIK